jgi:hypothetical protein
MTAYETRKKFESRLRKIVLFSADAIPDRVVAYLRAISEGDRQRPKEEVLKTFVPLVDHLPVEFVDFALREMIAKPDDEGLLFFHDFSEFGIEGARDYFPPGHVHGPFLRLLRTHEDQALRLIHGLTNAATAYWCGREKDERYRGYSRTPLPIILRFTSGSRQLWGNEEVYCWFRHTSVGPYAVISALMALEVWMEEQLESGRDSGELISKVLAETESVAVLGVCIAVALAAPERCLAAILPAIGNPRVWLMDLHRFQSEGTPIIRDSFGHHKFVYDQLIERNKCPQRRRDIRDLVKLAVFTENADVRAAFERAFVGFGDELPFQFEEEKGQEGVSQALQLKVEDLRGLLRRDNYRRIETAGACDWQYQPPREATEKEEQQVADVAQFHVWLGLGEWAQTTLESETTPESDALAWHVRLAKSYHRENDFTKSLGDDPIDATRHQAIAAVASAVVSKALPWAQEQGHADWCRLVLLAAANSPHGRNTLECKLAAALGLTALVARGAADANTRMAILSLVMEQRLQVMQAVFEGLRRLWGQDEVLCWNCLSLALSQAIVPGNALVPGREPVFNEEGAAWLRSLWERHAANLERGDKPRLPAIVVGERGYFRYKLAAQSLERLPVAELVKEPEAKTAIFHLADELLAWTISENRRGSDGDKRPRRHSEAPLEWNKFFMGWLAQVARDITVEEAETHIFGPVKATWAQLPNLTADLLDGLLQYQIGHLGPQGSLEMQAFHKWEQICLSLLDTPELARCADSNYLGSEWSAVVTLMVFVNYGSYVFNDEWPHVLSFANVINKWLNVVGTNHYALKAFITMLKGAWRHIPPSRVVAWLSQVSSQSEDPLALWEAQRNGERAARLLHSIWQSSRTELRADAESLRQFSELVDLLAACGITLAAMIQSDMESRSQ